LTIFELTKGQPLTSTIQNINEILKEMQSNLKDFITPISLNSIIHEYELIAVIGQGGFGTTYLCQDQNLNRKCVFML